jgi:hypothetical protein
VTQVEAFQVWVVEVGVTAGALLVAVGVLSLRDWWRRRGR